VKINYKSLNTEIGLGVTRHFTVKNNATDEFYDDGSFDAVLIENTLLIQVDLLSIIITTYLYVTKRNLVQVVSY